MKKSLMFGAMMMVLSGAAAAFAGSSMNGITVFDENASIEQARATSEEGTAGGGYRADQELSNGITAFETAAPKAAASSGRAGASFIANGITEF